MKVYYSKSVGKKLEWSSSAIVTYVYCDNAQF